MKVSFRFIGTMKKCKRKEEEHMDTITSKQLYELITSGKMAVTLITSRYFNMIDMVDIIEWKCNVNTKGTVILTADLHDSNVGEYIEVLGVVSDGMSIEQFEEEVRNGMKPLVIC